jgi:hypothetical protein
VRHGDLFYRGSILANLLPVEVVTKTGSLQPFPSLKRSLRPSELHLLNQTEHKVPARTEREMCPWAVSKCFGDLVSNTSA